MSTPWIGIRKIWNGLQAWLCPDITGKLLPVSLLHRITEQRGLLYARDLQAIDARMFMDALIYLVAKILHGDPDKQRVFFDAVYAFAEEDDAIAEILRRTLAGLPPDQGVEALKLFQLQRQGFELWEEKYRAAAQRCAGERKDIVLVAYAPIVGLRAILHAYRDTDCSVYVVSDKLIADAACSFSGYWLRLAWNVPIATILPKTYVWPGSVAVLEDTVKQGSTLRAVSAFLRAHGAVEIEEIILARSPAREI